MRMDTIKMKDIPSTERPCERCLQQGPETLSDGELLSVIIRTGSRGENSLELAEKILALNYPEEGILGLLRLSQQELMTVRGIGRVKAAQLVCIGELSRRLWKRNAVQEITVFHDPESIVRYCMQDMRHMEQEQMRLLLLNTKQRLLREVLLSKGTVNATLATPREIFIEALRYHAVNLIMVHNHPSGDPTPSRDDVLLTRRVMESGKLIGIQLIDHIVIGDNSHISLKERGLL